jgi:hypothetical protein
MWNPMFQSAILVTCGNTWLRVVVVKLKLYSVMCIIAAFQINVTFHAKIKMNHMVKIWTYPPEDSRIDYPIKYINTTPII